MQKSVFVFSLSLPSFRKLYPARLPWVWGFRENFHRFLCGYEMVWGLKSKSRSNPVIQRISYISGGNVYTDASDYKHH